MKKLISIISLLAFALLILPNLQAQTNPEAPKDGFDLVFSQSDIELSAGATQEISLKIIRSKRFKRAKIQLLSTGLPEGLNIDIQKDAENVDTYILTITSSQKVASGDYTATIMGKSTFLRKGKLLDISIRGAIQNDATKQN